MRSAQTFSRDLTLRPVKVMQDTVQTLLFGLQGFHWLCRHGFCFTCLTAYAMTTL